MKKNRTNKILLGITALLVIANVVILTTDNTYLYRAILYNFANINDNSIFEGRKIENAEPREWPLGSDYNKREMPDALLKQLEDYGSVAWLVIKDDSLRAERYWDHYSSSSLSSSFSMAKTVVSILTGIAIDEGKIKSVDQPVGDFLPEFREGDKSKITIRHLLTMSSGLGWNENYGNPFSITTKAYYGTDLRKLVTPLKAVSSPGKQFKYSSGDSQILSFVVAKAVGMTISEYASQKLWKPLGAVHAAEWSLDKKDGSEKGFCCIFSNARDFARIGQLYLRNGNWKGKQLVSADYAKVSLTAAPLKDIDGNPINYYGYCWWLAPGYKGDDVFYARGILGQYIIVVPGKNMVIVRLGNARSRARTGIHPTEIFAFIDGAIEMCEKK